MEKGVDARLVEEGGMSVLLVRDFPTTKAETTQMRPYTNYFLYVAGENNTINGNISSLPKSISTDRMILEK